MILGVEGFAKFLTVLSSGLSTGSVAALVALGFMLTFKATNVVNFAQGSLVTLGAYVAVWGNEEHGMPILLAYAVAVVALFAVGVGLERFAYAPIRRRPVLVIVIATLGASIVIDQSIAIWQGSRPKTLDTPVGNDVWNVAGARIPYQVVLMVAATAVLLLALGLLFSRTNFGRQLRALAADREAAMLQGVRAARMSMLAFGLSAAVSAIAGVLIAPRGFLTTDLGFNPMLTAFAAAVLGGFGSFSGVVVAAMVLALVEQFGGAYIDAGFKDVYPYVLLLAVLAIRPQGLFRTEAGQRV